MRTTTRRVWSVAVLMLVVLSTGAGANAQALADIKSQAELDRVVTALDTALFDAYNRCDLEKFSSFFTGDVEFYHDQGGLTLGNADLTKSIKDNICGGDVRRDLVSLRVYHMKGYGAVEIGVHRFYHPKTNTPPGEGQFINVWQYKDGAWKVTRAISFDHHEVK